MRRTRVLADIARLIIPDPGYISPNCAQVLTAKDRRLFRWVSCGGTENLLQAAQATGTRKVVHTSSSRCALAAVLLVSFVLNSYHLWWGLPPSGNVTWALDAPPPLDPVSIAHKSLLSGWNSGWFYFKAPIGHHLLLLVAYLPYLVLLKVMEGVHGAGASTFETVLNAESTLTVLALIGRMVSAVMGTATIYLLYRVVCRLFGREAALWAAAAAAANICIVYYSHTTNIDIPYLFWTVLAWDVALGLVDTSRLRGAVLFGAASGMAMASKEQALGVLVGLGVMIVIGQLAQRRRGTVRGNEIVAHLAAGVGAAMFALLFASNAFYNPLGFYRRALFLSNTLQVGPVTHMVPRASFMNPGMMPGIGGQWELVREACWVMAWSMGFPWFALSLAGLVLSIRRSPTPVLLGVIVPLCGYCLISLPALPPPPNIRYALPMTLGFALFGGVTCMKLWHRGRVGKGIVSAVMLYTLAAGSGVDYLMANDPRYQAADWLRDHARPGTRLETYHKGTFLPRFPEWLTVARPEFAALSRAGFERRAPDLVLVNLADTQHITERLPDTVDTQVVQPPENAAFLQALLDGQLEYRPIATFQARWPLIPDGLVRSLSPTIVLFARRPNIDSVPVKEGMPVVPDVTRGVL